MLVDTHCHLYFEQFDADRDEVFAAARREGVRAFVNVGIDEPTSRAALKLAVSRPDTYATVGLHPHSAEGADDALFRRLEAITQESKRVVAVGECGLDYFKSTAPREEQARVFSRMAALAAGRNLPLVVHSRDAFKDTLGVLAEAEKQNGKKPKAVFHCFSYDAEALAEAIERGFLVSFTANVTFPSAVPLREAVRRVPMDRFFIETDAPYLAPQPKRGKRNEPAFLPILVRTIAELKGAAEREVEDASSRNAEKFFGITVDRS